MPSMVDGPKISYTMETMPPMTAEAIARTEKKMNMTLDDIIKMSRKSSSKAIMRPRASKISRGFLNGVASQVKSSKILRFMDSRSSLRQDVLAQRRSNFKGNQFAVAKGVARRAAIAPIWNRTCTRNSGMHWNKPRLAGPPAQMKAAEGGFVGRVLKKVADEAMHYKTADEAMHYKTLDSLFANMKEQRMRVISKSQYTRQGTRRHQRGQLLLRSRGGRGGSSDAGATLFAYHAKYEKKLV
ncbi:uncharacterized protein LOC131241216 isoform X3 [Magnolia sinica]|uniref:uncharacterized protein LOC131241216 isoform X3 n=1 Tax=Magnolia sinica TaxID=86752 RepID=UPI002659A199|nr:uncharacterized protein LOC131241216 isoform X3 [Magnolia sinica]